MPNLSRVVCLLTGIAYSGGICAASTATLRGATLWQPTDSNTHYLVIGDACGAALDFALFDYDETTRTFDPDARIPIRSGDQIRFTKHSGLYFARNGSIPHATKLPLGISNTFLIGGYDGTRWILDDGTPLRLGRHIYALDFVFPGSDTGTLIQIDAKPVGWLTAVPAPAPGLLLISGLLPLLRLAAGRHVRPARTPVSAQLA